MLRQLTGAALLLAACVAIHSAGTLALLRRVDGRVPEARPDAAPASFRRRLLALAGSFVVIFFLHVAEMALWAGVYRMTGAIASFEEALYFSIVSYTTVGYGDVVLPVRWRILGAAEAATGTLLLGWSTGLLFALISRIHPGSRVDLGSSGRR